jgi:aldehyde:ferredoxin oxidoreductase
MFGLYDAAGRTGLGAVMGSKNLKAIAVRGTSRLEAKDKEGLQQIARDFVERGKKAEWIKMGTGSRSMDYLTSTGNLPVNNFRDGEFPEAMQLDGETILKEMGQGMDACFACSLRCKKRVAAEAPYVIDPDYGGPEYETIASLGSCVGVSDAAVMCKANEICNAYSLDTISTGLAISFAMECFEEGLLTLKDTQGIELKFGNGNALLSMIDKIAHRDGLGSLLAEGPARAARQIGVDASRFAIHVKNQGFPAHEPRLKRALTFGYAVSPTGADHIQAMQGQAMSVADTEGLPADPLLRGLGLLEPLTSEGIEYEKIRASVFYSMIIGALNCLVYCHLAQIAVEMSAQDMVDLVKAGTGWDVSSFEIMKAGERAYTLARVYNMREGLTAADDRLPDRMYAPTTNGPLANVHIDRQEVQNAIHAYYAMMGWDPETGIPTQAKLHELGVGWAITHLPS